MKIIATVKWILINIIGDTLKVDSIPFRQARLCVNCEHVIRDPVCPNCGSKYHIVLSRILGVV